MMPAIYGGYTYGKNVRCVPECFLCGNVQAMERILPLQLAQVKNCNSPFFPAAAHVLIGLWRREHPDPDLSPWFRYPEGMELLGGIYAPPPRLVLRAPAPEDERPEWLAHGVKWVDSYMNEPWDMGAVRSSFLIDLSRSGDFIFWWGSL